jgi:hypothetical protein
MAEISSRKTPIFNQSCPEMEGDNTWAEAGCSKRRKLTPRRTKMDSDALSPALYLRRSI